jgi:hypothetical protein
LFFHQSPSCGYFKQRPRSEKTAFDDPIEFETKLCGWRSAPSWPSTAVFLAASRDGAVDAFFGRDTDGLSAIFSIVEDFHPGAIIEAAFDRFFKDLIGLAVLEACGFLDLD